MFFRVFWLVSMVFQVRFMVFHGFWLVSMVFSSWFHGFSWFFVGFHGFSRWFHGFSWFLVGFHGFSRWFHDFSWFQVDFSCFFMFPGWYFMVFLQNVPAQTVSWPEDPAQVRRPEGGTGPSDLKRSVNLR